MEEQLEEQENSGIGLGDTDPTPMGELDDSWVGESLDDVQEQQAIVPASRNVLFHVDKVEVRNKTKEGNASNWRKIALNLRIVNGIEVDGETHYQNKVMFVDIPYYANPTAYDFSQPYFKNGQNIVKLKQIVQAIEMDAKQIRLIKGGINDEMAEMVANEVEGKKLQADILVKDETRKNDDGEREKTGVKINEVVNFVSASDESLV